MRQIKEQLRVSLLEDILRELANKDWKCLRNSGEDPKSD